MSNKSEETDRRIAEKEQELARIQTESIPQQLESNLVKDALKVALANAEVFAETVSEIVQGFGEEFAKSVKRMSKDLNGKGHD